MTFRPNPGDTINICGSIYRVAEHPAAPGMAYGQTGRRGTVYQIIDESGEAWALKVFQRRFREPRLVGQAERIASFAALPHTRAYAGEEDKILNLSSELINVLHQRERGAKEDAHPRIILVIDDYDFFEISSIKDELYLWARKARAIGFHILMAGAASELGRGFDKLRRQVLTSRCGFLMSNTIEDGQIFKVRIHARESTFPAGRGYLIRRGQPLLMQWALPMVEFSHMGGSKKGNRKHKPKS